MGEIADMMLDGCICQWCGEIIGDGDGYARICAGCQMEHNVDEGGEPLRGRKSQRRVPCPDCERRFKTIAARDQHRRDKHGRELTHRSEIDDGS